MNMNFLNHINQVKRNKLNNFDTLSGQFICSDWWKLKCKYYDKNLDFVILIVKTDTSIIQLEKDMNSLKNPFLLFKIFLLML